MERFIEQQNVALLRRRLAEETGEERRVVLRTILQESQRRLALIEANLFGARSSLSVAEPSLVPTLDRQFATLFERALTPSLLIDPGPGLHLVDANDLYAVAAMIDLDRVAGQKIFDVFPDNPADPSADGVANLYASLQTVVESGQAHSMAIQRYDVQDGHGRFVERYWQPLNTPVMDQKGKLTFILHQVVDVTDEVLRKRARQ